MVSGSFHGDNMPSALGPRSVTVVPMFTYQHEAQETSCFDNMDDRIEQSDAYDKELGVSKVTSKHMTHSNSRSDNQPVVCKGRVLAHKHISNIAFYVFDCCCIPPISIPCS